MRNSSSSSAALVSALSKQRPVVDAPDIWVLFFLCAYVCVYVFLLGLPLAKPSLLHLHFLRTPWLSLLLSVEGLMSSLTSLHPPWLSHGTEGEEESRVCRPSFIPLHLGSVKKTPEILAVTNRAIKLYRPAEHATLLMLWEVMQKWHHPCKDLHTWWLTTVIYTTSVRPKLPLATITYFIIWPWLFNT